MSEPDASVAQPAASATPASGSKDDGGKGSAMKKAFTEKSTGGKLSKDAFKELVIKLSSGGKKPPSDKDLDAAFELADADSSKTVEEAEFLALVGLIEKGEVHGLSKTSMMYSSKKKRASFQAKLKSEIPPGALPSTAEAPHDHDAAAEDEGEHPAHDDGKVDEPAKRADTNEEPVSEPEEQLEAADDVQDDMGSDTHSDAIAEDHEEGEEGEEGEGRGDEEDEGDDGAEDDGRSGDGDEGALEDMMAGHEGDHAENEDDPSGTFAEGDVVETVCGEEGEDEYWMPAQVQEILYEGENVDG